MTPTRDVPLSRTAALVTPKRDVPLSRTAALVTPKRHMRICNVDLNHDEGGFHSVSNTNHDTFTWKSLALVTTCQFLWT